MSIKPLVILPDPLLRQVSKPVERFDADLRKFSNDMLDTMYDAPGIGLAAIQVAEPLRMLVIDLAKEDEPKAPQVFINPEILSSSTERNIYEEGCLSIPDYYAEVERPAKVRVAYFDIEGKKHEIEADGLLATCLQHEIDHLNGVLFIDYISRLKR
ncbi:MAG: peptide deformylase, partial [Phyllobacterium sp.]|nr:peptide deformylase [Phyllobacterium sp.]